MPAFAPIPTLTPLEPWIATKIGCACRSLAPDRLAAYQLEKLNDTLALVQAKSRFYRRSLGPRTISLAALDETAELPLSSADDLREAPFDFLCVRQDDVERIVTLPTSGTTGLPKRLFFSAEDQDLTRDFFHHGMSTLVGPGDRVLILLPGSLPGSVGDLLADGLARMNAAGIPHGPVTDARHTLEVMESEAVTALVGIPVQVLALARLAAASGRSFRIHSVLLSTDRVPRVVARAIEAAFACRVYNHYGTTEMGLGGGVDCRARAGYHLREADLLFEVVDPATGRPVADGEMGEVVFTTLTRQAMPLVRYRTGDVSHFIPEPCPCGSVLKRLAHVDERLAGKIALPSGEVLRQGDFDEALFAIEELADFRVAYRTGDGGPVLTVEVAAFDAPDVDAPGIAGAPPVELVRNALLAIPAVAHAVARERLLLEVRGWTAGGEHTSGTQKRQILRQGGVD